MSASKRHPAEVTVYRLLFMLDKYAEQFTAQERDAIGIVIAGLDEITAGER